MQTKIRKVILEDREAVLECYRKVAQSTFGLARRFDEIDHHFVDQIIAECTKTGLFLAIEDTHSRDLMGLIHATSGTLQDLSHVMSNLTIIVLPENQGRGLGKQLFQAFLQKVVEEFPWIFRIELRARASSLQAIELYKSLGFVQEGLFKNRILNRTGNYEDGVPMAWTKPGGLKSSEANAALDCHHFPRDRIIETN